MFEFSEKLFKKYVLLHDFRNSFRTMWIDVGSICAVVGITDDDSGTEIYIGTHSFTVRETQAEIMEAIVGKGKT